MKKVIIFLFPLICTNLYAAQTASGDIIRANKNAPQYLADAADAWASVLGGVGASGDIAAYIRDSATNDRAGFFNTVSILAYNDSALTLYQTTAHLDNAFSVVRRPLARRLSSDQVLAIEGDLFAAFDEYDNNQNADFKTRTIGGAVRASGFITNSFAFGIQYATGHTETRHSAFNTDGTSNSITIFSQYLGRTGLFLNMGINGGTTRWESDKTIAGVPDNGAYNTDFYAGEINMGSQMQRWGFSLTPQLGVKYARVTADRHVDFAAQTFEKWWYNTLTGMAGLRVGYEFAAGNMLIRPTIMAGGAYDAISNGTDNIRVAVISGEVYDVPIDAPHRSSLNVALGAQLVGVNMSGGLDYKLDARKDYIAHTARLNVKFIF